jgi:hypothetical protein
MAQQLNDMFSNRCLNGQEVKAKISNLVTEYRKRKKEQGRTGASPCSWRYFDPIDKLLGEFHSFIVLFKLISLEYFI